MAGWALNGQHLGSSAVLITWCRLVISVLKAALKSSPFSVAQDEFFDFARDMIKTGPDAFFARVGRAAFTRTLVLPGASYGIKRVRLAHSDCYTCLALARSGSGFGSA